VPQTVLAAYKSHDAGGVAYVNTLAIQQDVPAGPDTALDYETIADDIHDWLSAKYRAMLAPQYTVDELHVLGILGGTGEGSHSIAAAGTLSVGGDAVLPKELTMVFTIKTADPSRRGRGRIFIPSPRYTVFAGDNTNWKTSDTYWTNAGTFGDELLSGHTVSHDALEHRYRVGVWTRAGNDWQVATSYQRRAAYHWLRSRSTAP
jgi:hypothetical protein